MHCDLHLLQARYKFLKEILFEQAKTLVRSKLGVAYNKKIQGDGVVKSCQYSPREVGNNIPVLILAATVITT